ncbi:MAG: hypothetical protein J7539_00835 [Niabella sp.]|nr:hypothetical protein [Niabella sp.]
MQRIREQEKKDAPEMKIAKQEPVSLQHHYIVDSSVPVTYHREAYPPATIQSPVKRSYAIFHPPCNLS